ncbi:MAG: diacylglycerol kinase family lipid kinase [Clostridia bacterium]|nr:diacylglycerol kinase family lipid kinase [Clostridia bacterium]
MKTAFIINPVAGRGRTAKIWPEIEAAMKSAGEAGDPYFTGGPGDAERLGRELPQQGYQRLLVLGGDGTVHGVLNGLEMEKAQIGILPTGTGNDFCRVLGISKQPKEALMQLLQGTTKKVDIGLVNGRRFLNTIGVGFDAEVVRTTNEEYRQLKGTLAYVASLIKVLAKYRNQHLTIETETATFSGKMLLAAVGNGQYVGGGMQLLPKAEIDDGVFHLCLLGDVSKAEVLFNMPKIFSGNHLSHPKVSTLTARKIVINCRRPLTVQADGEIIGETPVEVNILPQALEILVPKTVKI